jgi:hypothetical protein
MVVHCVSAPTLGPSSVRRRSSRRGPLRRAARRAAARSGVWSSRWRPAGARGGSRGDQRSRTSSSAIGRGVGPGRGRARTHHGGEPGRATAPTSPLERAARRSRSSSFTNEPLGNQRPSLLGAYAPRQPTGEPLNYTSR